MYKRIESWLVARGFLHPTHSRWERRSGVLTAVSIAAIVVLVLLALLDLALLDGLLFPILHPVGSIALGTFVVSIVLGILASNELI
jgi:uncharacterized membrane protein YbaN (DUF454 family)